MAGETGGPGNGKAQVSLRLHLRRFGALEVALATLCFAHLLLFWPKFAASTARVCDKPLMGAAGQKQAAPGDFAGAREKGPNSSHVGN